MNTNDQDRNGNKNNKSIKLKYLTIRERETAKHINMKRQVLPLIYLYFNSPNLAKGRGDREETNTITNTIYMK